MSVKVQLLPVIEKLGSRRRLIYMLARIFVVLLIGAFVFEHGNWTRTEMLHGPFMRDSAGQYSAAIGSDVPYLLIPGPQMDSEGTVDETSSVQLWVNGKPWNPPEAALPAIDQG